MITALVVAWFLQNFFQALFWGWAISPDIFLLTLLTVGLMDDKSEHIYIWGAFVGGLLFDLRWTGIPGIHGALFSAAYMAASLFWSFIPKEGRVPSLFLMVVSSAVGAVALFRLILSKTGFSIGTVSFGTWVLLTAPCVLISWLFYSWFYRRENV